VLSLIRDRQAFQEGSNGSELIPEVTLPWVQVFPGEPGLDCFSKTGLDEIFTEKGVRNIVLTGAVTNLCVDATGRSAHERGYNVYVLSDVTCSYCSDEQEFYLKSIFPLYSTVLHSNDLIEILNERESGNNG
jgi:nicotinamidase-related amidase